MFMPQSMLIMGTSKCSADIGTQYDAYVITCATDELCDEIQTRFSRFMKAHIIISHKPFNLTQFLFLTHNVNLFYIEQHFWACCSSLRPVNHSPSDEQHLSRRESLEINSLIPLHISMRLRNLWMAANTELYFRLYRDST